MKKITVELKAEDLKKKLNIKDGVDGRNPIFIGKKPPINPKKGDLWYKE